MPISSFYGLQTSLRGLLAQQRALDVAGHNVANASTAGFSRQEAVMAASPAYVVPASTGTGAGAHLGSGVDVLQYRRVRDQFLDLQFRAQNTRLGYESTRAEQLDRAEVSLAEPSDSGIASQLAAFWDAWSDVANAPQDMAARTALTEQGATLGESFATVINQLKIVADQASEEYARLAGAGGEVELIAREITSLNDTIAKFVSAGDSPNDLHDRRDLLVDQLSKLGRVSVQPTTDGMVEITFGDAAQPIVSDRTMTWPQALTDPDGRLGALRDIFKPGGTVEQYRDALDGVALSVMDAVNGLHTSAGGPPFFTATAGDEAGTLTVAVAPSGVQTGATGFAGDNGLALQIAALRGNAAVDGSYRSFVARVGTEVRQAQTQEANADALATAVDNRRQSVSGVSLDEEMANIIRFQRGYQASSRAMSTMDEMLDVLINRTGRVGL